MKSDNLQKLVKRKNLQLIVKRCSYIDKIKSITVIAPPGKSFLVDNIGKVKSWLIVNNKKEDDVWEQAFRNVKSSKLVNNGRSL